MMNAGLIELTTPVNGNTHLGVSSVFWNNQISAYTIIMVYGTYDDPNFNPTSVEAIDQLVFNCGPVPGDDDDAWAAMTGLLSEDGEAGVTALLRCAGQWLLDEGLVDGTLV